MKDEKRIISFRLPIGLIEQLDKLGKEYDRSRNYLVEKAIEKFLEKDEPLDEADKIIKEILNRNQK